MKDLWRTGWSTRVEAGRPEGAAEAMGARKDGAGTWGVAGQRREVAGLEMEFEGATDGTGPCVLLL